MLSHQFYYALERDLIIRGSKECVDEDRVKKEGHLLGCQVESEGVPKLQHGMAR